MRFRAEQPQRTVGAYYFSSPPPKLPDSRQRYTKQRLTSLHKENIMVQRSPSHFQTGTFYWAHVWNPSHPVSHAWPDYLFVSMKKCVLSTKPSRSWVDSTCASDGGIHHNTFSSTTPIRWISKQANRFGRVSPSKRTLFVVELNVIPYRQRLQQRPGWRLSHSEQTRGGYVR